jgi:penicillin-binding protein 1A
VNYPVYVTPHIHSRQDQLKMVKKRVVKKAKSSPVKKKNAEKTGPKRQQSARVKRKKPWSHVHGIVFLVGISLLLNLFIGFTLYLFVLLDIPKIENIQDYRPKMTTLVKDSNHKVIKRIYDENRRLVSMDKMPALLPKAFVAAEDARFYEHPGVDIWSIFRALFHNIKSGSRAQGGSTITQQVTRSLLLSRKKVYSRKIKEAILAYRIDSLMSKDDILYIYLNQIYLGEGAYGVEAASLTYFNKGVNDLGLAEMALLAGLPQAPSRYSPFKNFDRAKDRQAYVLNRMVEEGYVSAAAARMAFDQRLAFYPKKEKLDGAEYYLQQVSNYVTKKYGQESLTSGGLTIYTCLDPVLQKNGVTAIKKGIKAYKNKKGNRAKPQAALVAMETDTGRVRALVGGTDYKVSQFDRATQARRQPGSAFKPIVYAAALEGGFSPSSIIDDRPLILKGLKRGKTWRPQNFDNRFYGPTTLREGLIHSRNIVAIKLLQEVGVDQVIKLARNLGISSDITDDLTLALGSSGIPLLEMTGAYTAFANHGQYMMPLLIEKIVDHKGNVLEENRPIPKVVIRRKTADQLDSMLQGVIEEGTGVKAQGLKVTAAGKTGTTDRYMDAWFIGYTSQLVTGVWMGHDKNISMGSGASGGRIAAPIWLDFMKKARHEEIREEVLH